MGSIGQDFSLVTGHWSLVVGFISAAVADEREHDDGDEYKETGHDDENEAAEEFWEEIHELASNFTVFLIFLHIFSVVVSSRLHKENLAKSMLTGKKDLQESDSLQ